MECTVVTLGYLIIMTLPQGYHCSRPVPPKISPFTFPNNASVGQRGTAICTATEGDRPLTFRWLKNGRRLEGKDGTVTDNVDFSVLKIESLDVDSSGNYTCVVTNLGGSASQSAALTVHGPPKVVPFVMPKNLLVGERISITCSAASGTKPLTFAWIKDDATLHRGSALRITDSSDYSTLSIENLKTSDAGNYTCVVSNSGGTVSHSDVLHVKVSTKISPFIFSKNLLVGERTSVMCATTAGDQPLTFAWLKDGKPLHQSAKINIASSPQFSTLSIQKLNLGDAGNYTCAVSNAQGTVSYTDALEVKAPPRILPFAFPRTLTVGETTSVTCTTAAGDESFKYIWLKDGSAVHPGENVKIVTSPDISVLKIDKLTLGDAGNYTCVVSNGGGTVSHASTLEIKAPPSLVPFQFPKNLEVQQRISVMCTISVGERPLQFAWLKDGSALASGSKNVRIVDNAEYSTLHIDVLSLDSAGNYTCSVTNNAGHASHTAPLLVHAPKIQPFSFPATLNVGERSGTMCIVSAGDQPLTFSWFKDGSALVTNENVKLASNAAFSSLNFVSLEVKHTGNYTCSVRNSVGSASFTAFLAVHSPPSWTEAPSDKALTAGETGSLTCKALGFPSPTIRWFKTDAVSEIQVEHEDGTFKIAAAKKEHQGTYKCVADNGIGTPLSRTVSLEVKCSEQLSVPYIFCAPFAEKPKLQPLVFPRNRIRVGESASALCALVAGGPDVKFTWFKENAEIGGAVANVKVENNKKVSVLTVEPASLQSAGNYTCTAENNYGTDANSATLVVEAVPQWIVEPKDVSVTAGQALGIECSASGFPVPNVSWRRADLGKDTSKTSSVAGSGSTALTVAKATKDMEGKYICEADNGIGSALKKSVFVKVKRNMDHGISFAKAQHVMRRHSPKRYGTLAQLGQVESVVPGHKAWPHRYLMTSSPRL
ncbi:hypothetical protein HPB50_011607 [Hyalomma asiaticum]|uniref:Uncharacterized protein n=1 Tax=Hyalomma asiaticum TaxID=266040 RepID=A0ACB7S0D0_HYAAI|nr:hypothetical protein HPB50_011607 [Hyalomma asiaticum]